MMINGRILIVSDRPGIVAELEPIVRAAHHLALTVPDGREALRSLEQGLVPDVIISDAGSPLADDFGEYVSRFRHINRAGAHLVVVDGDAPAAAEPAATLRHPFRQGEVRGALEEAVGRMKEDVVALRAQMCREMEEMRHGMRELRRDVVSALGGTIAARDPYMHGHSRRVADLACRVADAMGLAPADVELLEVAALVHEIGKVVVPLELLHKTAPLSPKELGQIRAHASAGARILEQVASLREVARIVEFHTLPHAEVMHILEPESRDLLLTGILHVADAYDAMASERAYRGALDAEYRMGVIRSGLGTWFHPAAAEMLLCVTG